MKFRNKYTKYETSHNIGDRVFFPETDWWVPLFTLKNSDEWEELKPLYVTEDGVDRYEYQKEWWIYKCIYQKEWIFFEGNPHFKVHRGDLADVRDVTFWENKKIFSTKEAAEKWMEENNSKYIFTTDDGVRLFYDLKQKSQTRVWAVEEERSVINNFIITESLANKKSGYEFYKYFSTEALAKKYVDDNNKYPKFLLTEDGVKVKESEMVYWVNPEGMYVGFLDVKDIHMLGKMKTYKYFSTKEKAEEYVLWNKPCLSLKDVMDKHSTFTYAESQLIAKAKNKQRNG